MSLSSVKPHKSSFHTWPESRPYLWPSKLCTLWPCLPPQVLIVRPPLSWPFCSPGLSPLTSSRTPKPFPFSEPRPLQRLFPSPRPLIPALYLLPSWHLTPFIPFNQHKVILSYGTLLLSYLIPSMIYILPLYLSFPVDFNLHKGRLCLFITEFQTESGK